MEQSIDQLLEGEGRKKIKEAEVINLEKPSNEFLKKWFWENFGANSYGARNWLNISLIAILFLTLYPAGPFGLLITGKIVALLGFAVGVVAAGKALWDGIKAKQKINKEDAITTYLFKDLIGEWLSHPRNIVQLVFGILLLGIAISLVVCAFPGIDVFGSSSIPVIQPFFDWCSTTLKLFSAGFSTVFNELLTAETGPIAAAVFMSVLTLAAYDVFCRGVKWVFPLEDNRKVPATNQEDNKPRVDPPKNPRTNSDLFSAPDQTSKSGIRRSWGLNETNWPDCKKGQVSASTGATGVRDSKP